MRCGRKAGRRGARSTAPQCRSVHFILPVQKRPSFNSRDGGALVGSTAAHSRSFPAERGLSRTARLPDAGKHDGKTSGFGSVWTTNSLLLISQSFIKNQSHETNDPAVHIYRKKQAGAAATSPRRGWDRFESGFIYSPSFPSNRPTPLRREQTAVGRGCPVDTSAAGRSADRGGSRDPAVLPAGGHCRPTGNEPENSLPQRQRQTPPRGGGDVREADRGGRAVYGCRATK